MQLYMLSTNISFLKFQEHIWSFQCSIVWLSTTECQVNILLTWSQCNLRKCFEDNYNFKCNKLDTYCINVKHLPLPLGHSLTVGVITHQLIVYAQLKPLESICLICSIVLETNSVGDLLLQKS